MKHYTIRRRRSSRCLNGGQKDETAAAGPWRPESYPRIREILRSYATDRSIPRRSRHLPSLTRNRSTRALHESGIESGQTPLTSKFTASIVGTAATVSYAGLAPVRGAVSVRHRGSVRAGGKRVAVYLHARRRRRPANPVHFCSVSGRSMSVGLCANCIHVKVIRSDRGSAFYRCGLSDTDPQFPKYPRLPVIQCPGYLPLRDNKQT